MGLQKKSEEIWKSQISTNTDITLGIECTVLTTLSNRCKTIFKIHNKIVWATTSRILKKVCIQENTKLAQVLTTRFDINFHFSILYIVILFSINLNNNYLQTSLELIFQARIFHFYSKINQDCSKSSQRALSPPYVKLSATKLNKQFLHINFSPFPLNPIWSKNSYSFISIFKDPFFPSYD